MVVVVGRAGAVRQDQALVPAIVGLAHRRVHADIGRDAGKDDVVDALEPQQHVEVGGAERALAGLVDDRFAWQRRQFGDDVPAALTADEHSPARPRVADAGADALASPPLVGGQVAQVGAVALARVHHVEAVTAHRREDRANRLDRRTRQ